MVLWLSYNILPNSEIGQLPYNVQLPAPNPDRVLRKLRPLKTKTQDLRPILVFEITKTKTP